MTVRADLPELGYLAFGADYFGGGQVLDGEARQAARARMNLTGIARSAFDTLVARPECDSTRVATLGYCFGGAMAVELARTGADMKAVIGFHPGIGPIREPEQNHRIVGSLLMCCGTADPLVPMEHVISLLEQIDRSRGGLHGRALRRRGPRLHGSRRRHGRHPRLCLRQAK